MLLIKLQTNCTIVHIKLYRGMRERPNVLNINITRSLKHAGLLIRREIWAKICIKYKQRNSITMTWSLLCFTLFHSYLNNYSLPALFYSFVWALSELEIFWLHSSTPFLSSVNEVLFVEERPPLPPFLHQTPRSLLYKRLKLTKGNHLSWKMRCFTHLPSLFTQLFTLQQIWTLCIAL